MILDRLVRETATYTTSLGKIRGHMARHIWHISSRMISTFEGVKYIENVVQDMMDMYIIRANNMRW